MSHSYQRYSALSYFVLFLMIIWITLLETKHIFTFSDHLFSESAAIFKTGNPWRIQIFYLEMPVLYKWDVSLKINEWFGNYLLVSLLHFFKILTRLCIDVYKYALMWTPIADFYITPCFYYSLCLFLLMSVKSIFQFFRVRFVH